MVTVDAGPVFHAVHDRPREVVCLRDWDEVRRWLVAGDAAGLKELLRPAGEDVATSYRVHDEVLKPAFPSERCAEPWTP